MARTFLVNMKPGHCIFQLVRLEGRRDEATGYAGQWFGILLGQRRHLRVSAKSAYKRTKTPHDVVEGRDLQQAH